jgi:hypothetical protein
LYPVIVESAVWGASAVDSRSSGLTAGSGNNSVPALPLAGGVGTKLPYIPSKASGVAALRFIGIGGVLCDAACVEPCVVGRESTAKGAGESRSGAAGPSCWLSPSGEGDGLRFATTGDVAPYRLGFGAGDCLGSADGRGVLTRVAARVTAFTRFLPAL